MSGDSGGGDSTQESRPWAGVRPYLLEGFEQAENLYGSGQLAPVAPQSAYTTQAQDLAAQYALGGGSGLTPQAQGALSDTLSGNYLSGSNPYMQEAIAYSQQPVIDAFNEQIAPGIDATFANTAGGMGSGAYAAQRNRAEDTLARNLAGAATQAGYQNYADERGRMMGAMQLAPGLDQAGYANFGQLGRVGAQQDARAQMEAGAAGANLSEYMRLLNNGLNFGTTTTQGGGGGIDPLSTIAGGAMFAAPFIMCDVRRKQDIERVGSLDIKTPLYRFRYKHEVAILGDFAPYHLGPMAQEVEKVNPAAVVNIDGTKYVNLEAL